MRTALTIPLKRIKWIKIVTFPNSSWRLQANWIGVIEKVPSSYTENAYDCLDLAFEEVLEKGSQLQNSRVSGMYYLLTVSKLKRT